MKRKIALLLALAMTASMLPVNVFANSSNGINKTVSVKDDDPVKGVYLKIVPKDEVTSNSSIVLQYTGSEVDVWEYVDEKGNIVRNDPVAEYNRPDWAGLTQGASSYDSLLQQYADSEATTPKAVLDAEWGKTDDVYIPWKMTKTGKTEVEVELFPIHSNYCDTNWSGSGSGSGVKPYYYIPLQVLADGEGDIKVTIDANESAISGGGTTTFAYSTSGDGATVATVDEIVDFNETNKDDPIEIRIKETVSGTFEKGTLTLRTNGGFNFANTDKNPITVTPGTNSPKFTVGGITYKDDDKIEIEITYFEETTKASGINIGNIIVEPDDEDVDWGAVNISVKGCGITSETIQVANRCDYGLSVTLNEDATSILTGFQYAEGTGDDLDEDDFETAEVHVEETIADSWNTKQKMYFELPAGVKIVDFDTDNVKYMDSSVFSQAYLTDDGSTLVIPRLTGDNDVNDKECTEFDITFNVTIDPAFGDNDITLNVYGAGIEEGLIGEKVIAKAVTPITVSTKQTKTNIGYAAIATADVTITENVAGALQDDEDIVLSVDTLWTVGDIGFNDNGKTEATANGGELGIKDAKVNSGSIRIPMDKTSYSTPGSITVTDIEVGTSRSVPYGDYDLEVAGAAVINNYDEDYDANYKTTTCPYQGNLLGNDDYSFVWTQDNTDSYAFPAYLSVATQTGTLDYEVAVTKDETTIYVDGKAYTMDVAPYIQASTSSMLVPLRFVTLALGVDAEAVASGTTDETSTVVWDANSKTATIFYAAGSGQKIIQFTAGSNTMTIDGTATPMANGAVAEITDGRMFVPFRALGTALGVPVGWDDATKTATYNAKSTTSSAAVVETTTAAEETTAEATTEAAEETTEAAAETTTAAE